MSDTDSNTRTADDVRACIERLKTDQQRERARRVGHRDLAAIHIYEFLRGPADPPWHRLLGVQQARFRVAFLVGAQSIDMRRVRADAKDGL